MAVGDVFRVAVVGGLNSQSIVNVFHYRQTSANSSGISDTESLARAVNAGLIPPLLLCLSEDVSFGVIESRTFNAPGVPVSGYDLDITATGFFELPASPPTVAVVVRKKTGYLGRKYRGRNYFAGIPKDHVDQGKIASGQITQWDDLRDAIVATIAHSVGGSPSFTPVIAALDTSVIVAPIGVRWNTLVNGVTDLILRSQRRREIGVGA